MTKMASNDHSVLPYSHELPACTHARSFEALTHLGLRRHRQVLSPVPRLSACTQWDILGCLCLKPPPGVTRAWGGSRWWLVLLLLDLLAW